MNHQVEKLILAAVALFAIRAMCEEVVDVAGPAEKLEGLQDSMRSLNFCSRSIRHTRRARSEGRCFARSRREGSTTVRYIMRLMH